MSGEVVLDDTFVNTTLMPVSTGLGGVLFRQAPNWKLRKGLKDSIGQCLRLFDEHHGISGSRAIPPEYVTERKLFITGLTILGGKLNLEDLTKIMEPVIETDWKAHVELNKEKRYRDHITHPVRVTAIGWWLIHAGSGRVMKKLERHYQDKMAHGAVPKEFRRQKLCWQAIVEYAWLACGLLHDVGFPLEYHLRSGRRLDERYGKLHSVLPPATGTRTLKARKEIERLLEPLEIPWSECGESGLGERLKDLFAGRGFKHSHALLSPLLFAGAINDDPTRIIQKLALQLAARAIVTHHDSKDNGILSDPLATLLFVADNIQGWQRSFLHKEGARIGLRRTIRPIVECLSIRLEPARGGYQAIFEMNMEERRTLKKEPYGWDFDKFCEPNRRVERLIQVQGFLPRIILSEKNCLEPPDF
jgi:hypothetical protein